MVSTQRSKASAVATHSLPMAKAMASPRMEENVAFLSKQLTELVEMLKQQKTMLEEHQKLITDLGTKKDDAQNEHSKTLEGKGDSLAKKKCTENKFNKFNSHFLLKSRMRESLTTIITSNLCSQKFFKNMFLRGLCHVINKDSCNLG